MNCQRRIPLEYIVNCRDLGGYPCSDGSVTKFGKILRAGIPKSPTQNDISILRAYGISTVIDLRGNREAIERPSVFMNLPDFDYHQISLLEINPTDTADETRLVDHYKLSVDNYKENVKKIFDVLSAANKPLLYHCFFGKDRTGILSAFILNLAGVSMEDIAADYQITYSYLKPFYDREIALKSGLIWETSDEHLRSDASNIIELLNYVEDNYGGVKKYLQSCGVDDNTILCVSRLLK